MKFGYIFQLLAMSLFYSNRNESFQIDEIAQKRHIDQLKRADEALISAKKAQAMADEANIRALNFLERNKKS